VAPLGAGMRWALALLAPRLPKRDGWSADLPLHTWAANVLGNPPSIAAPLIVFNGDRPPLRYPSLYPIEMVFWRWRLVWPVFVSS
jgi:hypothetical protein